MIDANQIFNAFYSQPQLTIPIETDDPINGKEQSLIQIVVFSDFFCPACKRFSRDLKKIIEEGKGTYSIIFKHFPLSSDCNHGIQQNLHPFACQAAYASVIAQMQGKFWALHDSLFEAKNLNNIELIRISAMRAGLESKYFDSLMQSEKVKEKVSRDIALARSLNIDATPTVYLNGRLVKDMRRGILEILVHQELKKHQNERQYSPKKIHK
jgi:protein-disulfide isomerase